MFRDREQLEFAISQYMDGALSAGEAAEVEAVLRSDPAAAELLREFREIDAAVKAPATPAINWDALAHSISARIDDALADEAAEESDRPESLPMPWVRARTLAIAASVVIAAGIAFKLTAPPQVAPSNVNTGKPTMVALIKGPSAEKAVAPAIAEVTIGPGQSIAQAAYSYRAAEAILTQPAQVIIEADTPTDRSAGLFQ